MQPQELTLVLPDFLRNSNDRPSMCPLEIFEPLDDTSLLEPPETNPPNAENLSFRARFMQGKESEYAATLEAYKEIYGEDRFRWENDYGDIFPSKIESLMNCRTYATMHREQQTGELTVFGSACRDRWCPMCAAEKASYATEQCKMYIDSLKKPRFLTLTLRNSVSTLKDQIEFLQESFRRLRNRAYWKKRVNGGIWFLQVKRGHNSGCWHPHLHILLDGHYLEQGQLSKLWELITCGSLVVDIRRIHDKKAAAEYVARYCARPAILGNMPMADRVEVIKALHGKRLCGGFGTGKEVALTPPKTELEGEWEKIGYYDNIVRNSRSNPYAAKILKSYWKGDPIPDNIFQLYLESIGRYTQPKEVPKKPQQFLLDFYKKKGSAA